VKVMATADQPGVVAEIVLKAAGALARDGATQPAGSLAGSHGCADLRLLD